LALSVPLWCQEAATPPNSVNSGNELTRLVEISARLALLNETLRTELAGSRKSSEDLALSLGTSKSELASLRFELEELRTELGSSRLVSSGLATSAESLEKESLALREALRRADSSLLSLEASFADYRTTAEVRTRTLEKSGAATRLWGWLASVLAAAGWTAFILVLVF
jgi:chromosome segregation ATPase